MRKICLFIAMSLDGYIADSNGKVDRLKGQDSDLTAYVITHRKCGSSEKIRFTDIAPSELIKMLKTENGKDIWICDGADLVRQLVNDDLINIYYITVIPTLPGSGIRLFGDTKQEIRLKLLNTRSYNGMTDLIYARR